LIFIFTKYLLNFEYFIHNKISLIIFCTFSIIIDIVDYDDIFYKSGGIKCSLLIFFIIFCEALGTTLERNLMNYYFFSPYLVLLIFGALEFIFSIVLMIITLYTGGLFCTVIKEQQKCFLPSVEEYFENFNFTDVIPVLITTFVKMIYYLLNIYIIYELGPNHLLIIYIIEKFFQNIYEEFYLITFVLFPFQLLSLLIYVEIIELDFCGLNMYTKNKITSRAIEDITNAKDNRIEDNDDDDEDDDGKEEIITQTIQFG
jgi:hypothetical protein